MEQETANPPAPRRKYDPDDIHLYTSPWVSGTRALNYFGSISTLLEFEKFSEVDQAVERAMHSLQDQCSTLGGNSIVGVECTINPFSAPPTIQMVGTAAELVPLFDP